MDMAERLTKHEGHPDEVAKWYAAQQLINIEIGKKMQQIRENNRNENVS